MHDNYQTNRVFGASYFEKLTERFSVQIRPEEFTSSEYIDPQKFYLEFKSRLTGLVRQETENLKEEIRNSSNCHLTILKYSLLTDVAVQTAFCTAIWFYNKKCSDKLTESSAPIALVARGGYGREEMYFRSNIDVQIYSKPPELGLPSDCVSKILKYFEYLFVHQEIFSAPCHFTHTELVPEGPEFDPESPARFCSLLEHRFIVGNKILYNEFASAIKTTALLRQEEIIEYCKSHKNYFEVQNTVFNQEPNLKEELRRLYWALFLERVKHNLNKTNMFEVIQELYQKEKLGEVAFKKMQNAFNFESRIRLFLHCYQRGAHRDVLSYEVREQVAEAMGFELSAFFQEYYYKAAYPLKRHSRNLFWEALSHDTKKIKTLNDHFGLNAEKQIIFIKSGGNVLAEKSMMIFQILSWVAKDNYHISFPVLKAIEQNAHQISPVFMTEEQGDEIKNRFRAIIKGKYFAKALRLLHEFGLLQNCCIPEFKKLCGLLQDIYVHKFPTDIHILAALDKLNELELKADADPFLNELYQSVKDKTALKLATLLHDIGKGFKEPGQNEELVGSRITGKILNNLDYQNEKRLDDVAFLVKRHLTMRDLMLLDPEEDETYERVWDLVNYDKERLKMLILLTYADRGGTKIKMSSSEIEQLKNFYQYILYHKKRRQVSRAVKLEFLKMIRLPREIEMQLEVYNEFINSKEKFGTEMVYNPSQTSDLIVCSPDSGGLLYKIAAVLFVNRINIAEANIHTEKGNVLDLFKIYNANGKSQTMEFSNFLFLQGQVKNELRKILVGGKSLASVYKGRTLTGQGDLAKYKNKKPKVKIIGRSVSIETPDILGTFMMEAKVFYNWNMEITRAVLHTQQETASNIFYLRQEDVNRILQDSLNFRQSLTDSLNLLQNPQCLFKEEDATSLA